MLDVARRRAKKRAWRAAKAAFVATSRVWVGPGVKMDSQRLVKKADIACDMCRLCFL